MFQTNSINMTKYGPDASEILVLGYTLMVIDYFVVNKDLMEINVYPSTKISNSIWTVFGHFDWILNVSD